MFSVDVEKECFEVKKAKDICWLRHNGGIMGDIMDVILQSESSFIVSYKRARLGKRDGVFSFALDDLLHSYSL